LSAEGGESVKNKLSDLNDHLFAQLERLGDEDLTGDKLVEEINRSKAVTDVAAQIIANGSLVLKAKIAVDGSLGADFKLPVMLTEQRIMHYFTPYEVDFIESNVAGRSTYELTDMVNAEFDLQLGRNQIRAFIKNHKLNTGLTGRFESGQIPFNKGKKKWYAGGEETQFKAGRKPWNYKPVGTERVNGDGYVDIKIADPNKWRAKHLIVWEFAYGPVPEGYAVLFGDGDRFNFKLENLVLVSRKELAVMNHRGLIQKDTELTKTGVLIAQIVLKSGERKINQRKSICTVSNRKLGQDQSNARRQE
jgi:hypothetical protein